MTQFAKDDLVSFTYTHELGQLNQPEAAHAASGLRREGGFEGLGEVVNPKPAGEGVVEFGVRLERGADLIDIIRAVPHDFTWRFHRLIDPNQSYAESGTLDGDEQWKQVEAEFTFQGFERES